MFGNVIESPQTEKTPFYPRSPYGVAKVYSHWITINYRESYKIFACSGILFNHESPLRGEEFVTRKITKQLCEIKIGSSKCLELGNLYAKRDWGHAKDYVEAMWRMMQKKQPEDYVIATGKQYTVKQFVDLTLNQLGIEYYWKGSGINTKCFDKTGRCLVQCDKEYFRPVDVMNLKGNYSKAKKELNWKPQYNIRSLAYDMIDHQLKKINDK